MWPFYETKDTGEKLVAFDFTTRVEEGAVDPGQAVACRLDPLPGELHGFVSATLLHEEGGPRSRVGKAVVVDIEPPLEAET